MLKKPPSKVAQKNSNPFFFLTALSFPNSPNRRIHVPNLCLIDQLYIELGPYPFQMCYNCISSSKNCPFDLDCNIKGTCHGTLISSTIENITNCQQNCLKDQKCLWHSYNSKTGNCLTFSDCFKIKSDLSPGFISRLKEISTPDFSTPSFNPGPFNPRLFNPRLLNHDIFNPMFQKFIIEKSGIERSGVEAWG